VTVLGLEKFQMAVILLWSGLTPSLRKR
jgi:hypothetical protein